MSECLLMMNFFGLKPRDDAVLSSINVKYTDAGIDVKFTVDQTSGKIPRKIFEDAGFKKSFLRMTRLVMVGRLEINILLIGMI